MSKPTKHYGRWRIRWTDERGERQSAVYDDYKQAAHELRRQQIEVEEIRRGLRSAAPPRRVVNDICDYWEEHRVPHKRSGNDDRSILRSLRSQLGAVPLTGITAAHGDQYRAARADLSPKTVRNHLTLLGSMLNLAVDLAWLEKAPKLHKPKVSLFETDYRWLRTKDEITRLLDASLCEGDDVHTLYAMAIYTGMRKGELATLQWPDVSLERRLITVQRSFHGPVKSARVRYVPILDPVLPVLRQWRLRMPGHLLFPNRAAKVHDSSARIFEEALHRTLRRAGFPSERQRGRQKPYVTFHDLRHTFASHWVMGGGDIFRLQRILGHRSIEMTMRYAHLAPEAYTSDYGRLGGAAATAEVIPLKPGDIHPAQDERRGALDD